MLSVIPRTLRRLHLSFGKLFADKPKNDKKMAEFCSQCSPFDNEYDIDIFQIALKLKKGHSKNILCEGCNIRAVYKDEQGLLYLGKLENKEIKLYPIKLEELIK